ncbi:hypothetical protein L9F63_016886, partial [Diploptera punctata]
GLELDEKYLTKLRSAQRMICIVNIIKWIVIVAGGGLGIAGILAGKMKNDIDRPAPPKPNKLQKMRSVITPVQVSSRGKY